MRPIVLTKALAAANAQAVCNSQALVAAGNLTINGADASGGIATLDTPRRILISSGGDDVGTTYTVYGTNGSGTPISENVAGTNGGTAATNQDFATVTQVAVSAAVATTVEVGTNTTGSTIWFVPNYQQQIQNIGVETVLVSGSATWSVETTQDDPRAPISIYSQGYNTAPPVCTPFPVTGLTNADQNAQGVITQPVMGVRLTVIAGTGTVRMTLVPAGLRD